MLILGDRLYVSTDYHAVQTFTYPAFEKDGIVTRFTAPVTHIAGYDKSSVSLLCIFVFLVLMRNCIFGFFI